MVVESRGQVEQPRSASFLQLTVNCSKTFAAFNKLIYCNTCNTHLEKVVELIAEILDKVHVGEFGEDEVAHLLGEGDLGVGEPRPVVRVRPPRVGVLEGEREAVVDGRDLDRRRPLWRQLRGCLQWQGVSAT